MIYKQFAMIYTQTEIQLCQVYQTLKESTHPHIMSNTINYFQYVGNLGNSGYLMVNM